MLADIFGVDGVIVLVVVLVLLFGGAAIPKLARNLGSAKNEFEKGLSESKKTGQGQDGTGPQSTTSPDSTPQGTNARGTAPASGEAGQVTPG